MIYSKKTVFDNNLDKFMEKIENVGRKKVRSIKWPIVLLFNDTALYQNQRTLKM